LNPASSGFRLRRKFNRAATAAEKCLKINSELSATPARHREPENELHVFGPQTARSGEAGGSAVGFFFRNDVFYV
jgi:hypothetical protein